MSRLSAAKFGKRDISRASEKAFPVLAMFLVAQLPPKREVLVHKNSLASYQRCRHSVEPRALTCPLKQSNLIAWSCLNLWALGEAFRLLYVVSYKLFWN